MDFDLLYTKSSHFFFTACKPLGLCIVIFILSLTGCPLNKRTKWTGEQRVARQSWEVALWGEVRLLARLITLKRKRGY